MNKILFFNTAWMNQYKGVVDDKMKGGGKHIEKKGWGGEMFNFKPLRKNLYGYVQVGGKININRIGAKNTDKKIKGVLIIWLAKAPDKRGSCIVGWYRNATVYRDIQPPPKNSNRIWNEHDMGYYVSAKKEDTKLLSIDERTVIVPRRKKGIGQKNLWYGDNNPEFVEQIFEYVKTGKFPMAKVINNEIARQSDPLKRIKVEKAAVKKVFKYYKKLGYEIESVEKDNVGWDLNAINDKIKLKLEVKGLSGKNINTELTPNELKNLNADKDNYRICIVIEALTLPKLMIFSYSIDSDEWISEKGRVLKFETRESARIY